MRVGLSLLTLAPGDAGGSETYARRLLEAFGSAGTHEYVAFVRAGVEDAAGGLPSVALRLGARLRGPGRIPAVSLGARLSRDVRRALLETDLVHYPLTVPVPRGRGPRIVTLHDLQHRDLPALFPRSQRLFRRRAYDRAARRADAVIVPSEFVRDRAVERLGLDPANVHVIHHGVEHARFSPGAEAREPFLLYPARPWKHKNHPRLLQAFTDLRRELPGLRLVLTGGGLERLEPLPDGVDRLGLVSADELASLYRRAACLVFPSLYEGFGLPVLEAMASGCPVAASTAGAIPEVSAGAVVLFDPEDVWSLTNAVREALAYADDLGQRGIARAADFTWAESARRHDELYAAVAR